MNLLNWTRRGYGSWGSQSSLPYSGLWCLLWHYAQPHMLTQINLFTKEFTYVLIFKLSYWKSWPLALSRWNLNYNSLFFRLHVHCTIIYTGYFMTIWTIIFFSRLHVLCKIIYTGYFITKPWKIGSIDYSPPEGARSKKLLVTQLILQIIFLGT